MYLPVLLLCLDQGQQSGVIFFFLVRKNIYIFPLSPNILTLHLSRLIQSGGIGDIYSYAKVVRLIIF